MKVIDLLNKIANGEKVPECIMYQGHYYYNVGNEEQAYYENTELDDNLFLYAIHNEGHLNEEVEIIEDIPKEDKKIEKFKVIKDNSGDSVQLVYDDMKLEITLSQAIILDKINEIIDRLNGE